MTRNLKGILCLSVMLSFVISGGAKAGVTGHTLLNDVVYFVDSDVDRPFILRYDVANEVSLSSLSLDTPPTAISSDSSGVYVAEGNSLSRLVFSGDVVTRTVLHNFPADILQIVPAGNYLLVVSGSPKQTVYVLNQGDGDIESEADFAEADFGLIEGIHHDDANDHIIIKFSAAVNDSVFIVASYDEATGTITDLDKFPAGNIATFTTPDFFGGLGLIVGSLGEVANFGATGVELRSPDINKDNPITVAFGNDAFYSAGTVTAVFETADSMIIGTSIDNACHSFNGGTRFRVIGDTLASEDSQVVFDSANVIHTIIGFGADDYLLFSGAAEALVVEKKTELPVPTFYGSEILDPLAVNFTPVQKLSAVGKDGDVLHMHVDATCDHQLVSWRLSTQSYLPTVNFVINTPIDTSYSVNKNQFWVLNNRSKDFYLRLVDFNDVVPSRISVPDFSGTVGQASQVVATDSYAVLRYSIGTEEHVAVIDLDSREPVSDVVTPDKSWDIAVWDTVNDRIYYISESKLFSRTLSGAGILGNAVQSPDYGITQAASTDSEIVVSANGEFLMVGGGRYNTANLEWLDSIGEGADLAIADMAAWSSASTVYAIKSGDSSALEEWTLNLGGDNHFGLSGETGLSGTDSSNTNSLLFPMMQGGSLVPLTVTVNSASALTYKTQGDDAISVSLGGGGSAGSGSDAGSGTDTDSGSGTTTGTDSTQPAEAIGGTGGGSIGYIYLLLLTIGFAVKRRRLN